MSLDRPVHGGLTPTVELLGVPGAGKTSVALALSKQLAARGLHVPPLRDRRAVEPRDSLRTCPVSLRRLAYLCWALGRPRAAAAIIARCFSPVAGARARWPFALGLMASLRFYRNARRSNADLVLMDQGLLQTVWSLGAFDDTFEGERGGRRLYALLQALAPQLPRALVVLEVDTATAGERIRRRPCGRSRFDALPEPALGDALARGAHTLGSIAAAWERVVDGPRLRLDARAAVDLQAAQALQWLSQATLIGRSR